MGQELALTDHLLRLPRREYYIERVALRFITRPRAEEVRMLAI